MPFGLSGAPATFQRMMDSLVCGLEPFAAAYLDDLVIHSQSWVDHLQHIRHMLQRLREAGLTAKPAKCQFGMNRCMCLPWPQSWRWPGTTGDGETASGAVLPSPHYETPSTRLPWPCGLLPAIHCRLCNHCSATHRPHPQDWLERCHLDQ